MKISEYIRQAAWLNAMNATFYSLMWDRSKWEIEEMADGSAVPKFREVGDKHAAISYRMPILDKLIKTKMGPNYSLGPNTIISFAKLHGDDSGAEARKKLVEAHNTIFSNMLKGLKGDSLNEEAAKLEKLIPELRRKLVWKKVVPP